METPEEAMGSTSCSSNGEIPSTVLPIVKGKRTKRQRVIPMTPTAIADTETSSSTSSAKSKSAAVTTEEDEDMANCLILLAHGRALEPPAEEKITTTAGKAGLYVYECKTCNKCFPSFQALGGHRASHKKPKIAIIDEETLQIGMNTYVKPAVIPTVTHKSRVHECSICGSEFSSGQALGGHMRRHKPAIIPEAKEGKMKEKNFLSLDLNLPAPEDDHVDFPRSPSVVLTFAGKRPVVFPAATALVGCHY